MGSVFIVFLKSPAMPEVSKTQCRRGTKCYFAPRALKTELTKCRPPIFLSVAVVCYFSVVVNAPFRTYL